MTEPRPPFSVLVVDDDAGVRYTLRGVLEDHGALVQEAADGKKALEALRTPSKEDGKARPFDLIFTDLRMPNMDGMELLALIRSMATPPKVVMITAHGSENHAVSAMKLGAFDYLRKPFELEEVIAVLERAAAENRLSDENERLRNELHLSRSLLFTSPAMGRIASLIGRVAPKNVTVLITGESGTGKERVAEAIVSASSRAQRPFLKFNCAALSPELAEAELFGHTRGAFTGAQRARPGLFREANGGTVLLDEVGELERGVQAKLLRVIQEGEVRPLGEDRPFRVDVRLLAATHRDLSALAQKGEFRDDLRYRLTVVQIQVPPLRERPEDIPVLSRHFFERAAERFGTGPLRVSPAVYERLAKEKWPGNVRELEHAVDSLVALSTGGVVEDDHWAEKSEGGPASHRPEISLRRQVDAFERGLIASALKANSGNKSETARRLGLSRATLHEKLQKYGLSWPSDKSDG